MPATLFETECGANKQHLRVCARACARACRGCTEFACYVMFDEPNDSWFVCLMPAAVICEPFIKLQCMVFVVCELFLRASATWRCLYPCICFHLGEGVDKALYEAEHVLPSTI